MKRQSVVAQVRKGKVKVNLSSPYKRQKNGWRGIIFLAKTWHITTLGAPGFANAPGRILEHF